MSFRFRLRPLMGVTFSLLFAGCSSGATSHLTPDSSGSGSSPQTRGRATVEGRLFIPGHTKATATAAYRSALSTRSPKYVSASTMGVAIKTTAAGASVDQTAFSTNSSDNPNCSVTMTGPPGTNCTFTVGALGPTTTFAVTAYDAEPSIPTGGSSSVPAGTALSTATMSAPITDGQVNPVDIALGGVVANYTLTSSTPNIGSTSRFSLPATGVAQTVTIVVAAQDADGNTIVTQTTPGGSEIPYANPITFTATPMGDVPGQPAHTTLTLTNATAGTTAQTTSPYTSSYSGDTFTLTYDGVNDPEGPSYFDAIAGTITSGTDAYSGATITPNSANDGTLTFSPLTVYANLGAGDSFMGQPTPPSPPTLVFTLEPAGMGASLQVSEAGPPTTGFTGYTLSLDAGANTCMGVAPVTNMTMVGEYDFTQTTAPMDDTGAGSRCVFDLSDGSSVLPIGVYFQSRTDPSPAYKTRASGQSITHSNAGIK